MKNYRTLAVGAAGFAIIIAGCAEQPTRTYPSSSSYSTPAYRQGVADRIEIVRARMCRPELLLEIEGVAEIQ